MSGDVRDAHVAGMKFYADNDLNVTKKIQDIFQHMEHQAEYHIDGIGEESPARR